MLSNFIKEWLLFWHVSVVNNVVQTGQEQFTDLSYIIYEGCSSLILPVMTVNLSHSTLS